MAEMFKPKQSLHRRKHLYDNIARNGIRNHYAITQIFNLQVAPKNLNTTFTPMSAWLFLMGKMNGYLHSKWTKGNTVQREKSTV